MLRFLRTVRHARPVRLGAPHLPILDTPPELEWLRGEVDFGIEDYRAAGLAGIGDAGQPATSGQLYRALAEGGVRVKYGKREYVVTSEGARYATAADAGLPLAPERWIEFVTVADPDTFELTFVGKSVRPGRRPPDLTPYVLDTHGWRPRSGGLAGVLQEAQEAAQRAGQLDAWREAFRQAAKRTGSLRSAIKAANRTIFEE